MRTFKGFNQGGPPCPACGTREDIETILVPIPGTEKGKIMQARQVHSACALQVLAHVFTDKETDK